MGYRLCISAHEPFHRDQYGSLYRTAPGVTTAIRREVSVHATYTEALAEYERLYRAMREGRLFRVERAASDTRWSAARLETNVTPVEPAFNTFLAVRDEDDPDWSGLPKQTLATSQRAKGVKYADDLYKRLGKAAGVHGHSGGWIYRGQPVEEIDAYGWEYQSHAECVLTPYQGWASWAIGNAPTGCILVHRPQGGRTRYYLKEV